MSTKIKSISITALRGIRELQLDLNGKNQVIRGDNGTGKTSVVDAIEFFLPGVYHHYKESKVCRLIVTLYTSVFQTTK